MTVNVEIVPRPNETLDKTLRRFAKKCKKEDIIKEHCERLHFKSKRQKRKEKRAKQIRLNQKRSNP